MRPHLFRQTLAELIAGRTGLNLREGQLEALEDLAHHRVEKLSSMTPSRYLCLLQTQNEEGVDELRKLISRVTICETYFFRDSSQCGALLEVLKSLSRRRRRPLALWSAGCSTGEEAYTLAILAAEARVPVTIMGTDIDTAALAAAREARYDDWKLRRLPEQLKARYLKRDEQGHRVVDSIRAEIRFQERSLLEETPQSPHGTGLWDVILCRNVFIYFRESTSVEIARRCMDALEPDGWFFTAPGDRLQDQQLRSKLHSLLATFAYRPGSPTQEPAPPPLRGPGSPESQAIPNGRTVALPAAEPEMTTQQTQAASSGELLNTSFESDEIRGLIGEGRILVEAGRAADALEVLKQAAKDEPLNIEAHYWTALAHRQLESQEGYEEALRRTLFLAPDFWPAAFLLGAHFEQRQQPEQALAAYRQALSATEGATRSRLKEFRAEDLAPYGSDIAATCRRRIIQLSQGRVLSQGPASSFQVNPGTANSSQRSQL